MKNRYEFIKKIYKEYIIFILKKNKYYVFNNDEKICKLFNINYYNIDNFNINYIVLNNLDISKKVSYDDNKYYEYLIKYILISIVKK